MKGYQIPFTNLPVQEKPPNAIKMSEQHSILVDQETSNLLEKRGVSEQHFSCGKEGWGKPSGDKSEKTHTKKAFILY